MLGEDLYPVVLAAEIDGMRLSVSLDGQTLLGDTNFEHKSLNATLRAALDSGVIPEQYHPQMEQGLLLTGANRCLFMASNGDRETMRFAWYESRPELRAQILPTWRQLQKDIAAYVPQRAAEKVVAEPVEALPLATITVGGQLTVASNLQAVEEKLRAFLANTLVRNPQSDQDFADLDVQIKALKRAEEALDAAEAQMLAQVESIDSVKRAKDMLHKLARDARLASERLLKSRKDEIRAEAVSAGVAEVDKHARSLNAELGLAVAHGDAQALRDCIKGLKSLDSLRNAISTEVARQKVAIGVTAEQARKNIVSLEGDAHHWGFLFPDLATVCTKPTEDFAALLQLRIAMHEEAASQKREAEQAREAKAAADAAARALAQVAAQAPAPVQPVVAEGGNDSLPPLGGALIKLGQINDRLAPVSITVAGLEELGFPPAAIDKNARLYREADFPAICRAISKHALSALAPVEA
jgi:predicted phage-related endonuclease